MDEDIIEEEFPSFSLGNLEDVKDILISTQEILQAEAAPATTSAENQRPVAGSTSATQPSTPPTTSSGSVCTVTRPGPLGANKKSKQKATTVLPKPGE